MNPQHFFADVDLPFHVWMREGDRWVLREAPQARAAEASPAPAVPVSSTPQRSAQRRPG